MPLPFHPRPGTLWMCDFDTGFQPPEMVKLRPVVVISPYPRGRMTGLCTIVPLSTVEPFPIEPFHHLMAPRSLPSKLRQKDTWAKCDMLYTISLNRLSRATDRGQPMKFRVLDVDLDAIRACVKVALGLDRTPGAGQ